MTTIDKKHVYLVTYKHGLHGPIKINADDEAEARKQGLAAYRYDYAWAETVSFTPVTEVVDTVTLVQ